MPRREEGGGRIGASVGVEVCELATIQALMSQTTRLITRGVFKIDNALNVPPVIFCRLIASLGGTEHPMADPLSSGQAWLQEAQYRFPYHYLPRLERRFAFQEVLTWGHEYLSYVSHVVDLVAEREWRSLLDVGCGDGRLVDELSRCFPDREVVGLDYSERAVALAAVLAPTGRFVCGDVTDPKVLGRKFDIMTCVDTIEHIEPSFLRAFIAGMRQHVRRGATLIVTVPTPTTKWQGSTISTLTPTA